ncbi:chloride channel CLIC-like protein 1 isoform X2 [Thunnus albacares]|uniref:chloride channel CLIC-like protein 1 isoform X2 n=1 Tax=Thunnus albacares TaxID=8236 RepID=UPI001CF7090E|nr:chloride channel CLIC-like protein 1 isoform X2 [Thunnus albacares]
MFLVLLVCTLALAATGQQEDEDWIDPYDMLNYDASTKTMRKPTEPANYQNVPTKRREYTQDSSQVELASYKDQVEGLKRQIEDQKKKIMALSQQPTCNPVFKRFLSRLLKEIQRIGLPSDSTDALYDAKIRLSRQSMTEIQNLLEGEDSWRTGALDNALSQILVDFKPHDYDAWKWHFEDTFGVEIDTLLKIGLFVLVIIAIICTELWSRVSWFMQFKRLFTVCFFVSIVWNWFYLYKIAFAEHQNNIAKMDSVNEKCTGVKKMDWSDSLKEWFRSTWTLQDDPCKRYYEVLMVNPILLVPPTKAISVTITTFITEPLKHLGQGISEFLRALLKDLPITLQIPVLLTIVISIVVCMYGSVQAAFRYGIAAPLRRRRRRDPPPPGLNQPQPPVLRIEDRDHLAGGDAPQQALRHRANDDRLQRNDIRQRQPNRVREEPAKIVVETLRTADRPYSEDETDGERREGSPESEQTEQSLSAVESDPQTESDSENQPDTQEELDGAGAGSVAHREAKANKDQSKTKPTDSSPAKTKPLKVKKKVSQDEPSRNRPQPAGRHLAQTKLGDDQDLEDSAEDRTTSLSERIPVQETSPTSVE